VGCWPARTRCLCAPGPRAPASRTLLPTRIPGYLGLLSVDAIFSRGSSFFGVPFQVLLQVVVFAALSPWGTALNVVSLVDSRRRSSHRCNSASTWRGRRISSGWLLPIGSQLPSPKFMRGLSSWARARKLRGGADSGRCVKVGSGAPLSGSAISRGGPLPLEGLSLIVTAGQKCEPSRGMTMAQDASPGKEAFSSRGWAV
jgi:hypothetical protein